MLPYSSSKTSVRYAALVLLCWIFCYYWGMLCRILSTCVLIIFHTSDEHVVKQQDS